MPNLAALSPSPKLQFFDSNGAPLAGGKLFTYLAGSSIQQATFTDSTEAASNTNPIILDSTGSASVWLGALFYRMVLQDANSVQIWDIDNISSSNLPFLTQMSFVEGASPGGVVASDLIYGSAAAHRLAFNNNNAGEDLIVGQNTVDTLTNKTLTSPTLHTPIIDTPTFQGPIDLNGVRKLDGIIYVAATTSTLALAITAAGSSGTIVVPPSAGTLIVPLNATVPAGVTLKIEQGAMLSIAPGQIVTISGDFQAGAYQVFTGSGTVQFTETAKQVAVLPEWWGAVADGSQAYPVTGTDNLAAFQKALAALPNYPGLPSQGPYQLVDGTFAKTGKVRFSVGRYVISSTWVMSPFVTYECPSYLGTFICLQDNAAASGAELWTLNVQALVGPSPNTSYGAQFINMAVEGNANTGAGGHNVKASGVIMNGAQGTALGTLWIENVGIRGFWLQNSGSNVSGLGGPSHLEVLGCTVGPGVQLDAGFATFGSIRSEVVNTAGTNLDADGDPNPALLIGSAASNGAINVNIDMFGAEFSFLPMKIWSGNAITIKNITIGIKGVGGAPSAIIISHGANAVQLGPMFTFDVAANCFTNFIVDRTKTPTKNVSGNFQDFPSILGYPLPPMQVAAVDLTAQTAAITTTTLFSTKVAGQYRVSWDAKVTTAAGTSSTLGALTIAYTDPDGVVQTITAPASIAAGTIATTSAGNTTGTVLLGLPLLLNCKAGTNITYAFGYASNAAAAMNYNLHIDLDQYQ